LFARRTLVEHAMWQAELPVTQRTPPARCFAYGWAKWRAHE
jgi:hypothetical protein